MPVVVGVDSSTQSTKVELRDLASGELVGSGQAAHTTTAPPMSEQDPSEWWGALGQATAQALDAAGRRGRPVEVAAIAVAGQQHGMVVMDGSRQVLRPAMLWNDTRSAPDAAWLTGRIEPSVWAAACGSVPVAAFTIAKLSWLHRTEPDTFRSVAHVLLPHDWLTFQLTGELVSDRGDASGTGYWSPSEDRYRYDLLGVVDDAVDWARVVPDVLEPWAQAGTLTREAADALGLAAGTPVAVGTGDNMAAALGIGIRPGEVAVSIGTSGTVFTRSTRPVQDPTGSVAGFADATGHYLPLVCTLNAALVTDAVARLLTVSHDDLDQLALQAPPGAGGLVLVPYLAGERTPNRPAATGSLLGIRQGVSRNCLARAAFEGVVCGLLDGLDALIDAGAPVERDHLVLVGGGSRSSAYRALLASLSGQAVTVPRHGQPVSTGAAVQAAVLASGSDVDDVTDAWGLRYGTLTEPGDDPSTSAEVRESFRDARG
ncbi:MAG: xylulokinase [Acidimicrobiales bacterium]